MLSRNKTNPQMEHRENPDQTTQNRNTPTLNHIPFIPESIIVNSKFKLNLEMIETK